MRLAKRRGVVKMLLENGFHSVGGTKHEKFSNGKIVVMLPRHSEINELLLKSIKKQMGLAE